MHVFCQCFETNILREKNRDLCERGNKEGRKAEESGEEVGDIRKDFGIK